FGVIIEQQRDHVPAADTKVQQASRERVDSFVELAIGDVEGLCGHDDLVRLSCGVMVEYGGEVEHVNLLAARGWESGASAHEVATVDVDNGPGDVTGRRGCEERGHPSDFLRAG